MVVPAAMVVATAPLMARPTSELVNEPAAAVTVFPLAVVVPLKAVRTGSPPIVAAIPAPALVAAAGFDMTARPGLVTAVMYVVFADDDPRISTGVAWMIGRPTSAAENEPAADVMTG